VQPIIGAVLPAVPWSGGSRAPRRTRLERPVATIWDFEMPCESETGQPPLDALLVNAVSVRRATCPTGALAKADAKRAAAFAASCTTRISPRPLSTASSNGVRLLTLDGPSMRTKYLRLDEPPPTGASTQGVSDTARNFRNSSATGTSTTNCKKCRLRHDSSPRRLGLNPAHVVWMATAGDMPPRSRPRSPARCPFAFARLR
jgi:hypothetical protein